MSRTRKILLIVLGVAVMLITAHLTVNGLPDLTRFNPHAR